MENISIEHIKTVEAEAKIEYFQLKQNGGEDILFRLYINGSIFFEGTLSEPWIKDTPISKLFKS